MSTKCLSMVSDWGGYFNAVSICSMIRPSQNVPLRLGSYKNNIMGLYCHTSCFFASINVPTWVCKKCVWSKFSNYLLIWKGKIIFLKKVLGRLVHIVVLHSRKIVLRKYFGLARNEWGTRHCNVKFASKQG